MKRLDNYWKSNKEWYHYEGLEPVMNEDAPEEAKKSFERYQKQIKDNPNAV